MMWWSHLAVMCRDPGFIPKGYKYDEHILAKPFVVTKRAMELKNLP